ncbi:cysteine--tRNA ligase [bacterium]|jgi:cysteinyl-tRNA synthetase|nr:cysteine--tRNA ligase [bacterium]
MNILLYNTLSRSKEVFKPVKNAGAGIYACGPTVYNFAHIGNLRTYIFEDLLKRMFIYNKYKVKHVMNITDVGHLTSDADDGEDKMLIGAKREGKSVWDIARFYEKAFFEDTGKLNIISPDIKCRATEHIQDMINLIKRIEENGFTYIAGGNLYFNIEKFEDYGKLSGLSLSDLKAGARVEVDENKKNPHDFVLWFTKSKHGDQDMQWESPWGRGFPGWHIECSAMSVKYLGECIDIHCGGIDHINVHHTNEIAQSEAATGKKWVNFWLHGEFLIMDKGKMSKSAGEFTTLKTLTDKGFDPLDFRYLCLGAHYRTQLAFSYEALESARNGLKNLRRKLAELDGMPVAGSDNRKKENYRQKFLSLINDDLNIPQALALLWDLIRDETVSPEDRLKLVCEFDEVLGLGIRDNLAKRPNVPEDVHLLLDKRMKARANKDWKESDRLREEVFKKGFKVEDTPGGQKVFEL